MATVYMTSNIPTVKNPTTGERSTHTHIPTADERILPNVPIHTIQGGKEEGQLTMKQVVPTVQKLPRKLNRAEVLAVRNRLAALGTQGTRPPIPKGIDPNKARPNHKAMRGR